MSNNRYDSVDQMLLEASQDVVQLGTKTSPRGKDTFEIKRWSCELSYPRRRCVTMPERRWDPTFCVAEWLWYMRGSDSVDEISFWAPQYKNFSDDGSRLHGAYGHRIFTRSNLIEGVINKLEDDPDTRQAIVPIFHRDDLFIKTKDVPCTLSWGFMIRDGALDMTVMMRSNDVLFGLPNDVFAFTMIQEYVAARLGVPIGTYGHFDISLHAYCSDLARIEEYIEAGAVNALRIGNDAHDDSSPYSMLAPPSDSIKLARAMNCLHDLDAKIRTGQLVIDLDDIGGLSSWCWDLATCLVVGGLCRSKKHQKRALEAARTINSRSLSTACQNKVHTTKWEEK